MSLAAGARLGPYEIVALIGAGGMGEVYRARDPRLGRDVAVKVLPSAFAAETDRLQRFEQEARAAAALNHPNILAVYDIGTHPSTLREPQGRPELGRGATGSGQASPYIVSELLEGDSLRDVLHGGPLPVRKAVEYAAQITQGLAAAHDKGIVHRDLKPENVFVTADGRVKILDFGLAKLTHAEPAFAHLSALPTTTPVDPAQGRPDTIPGMVLGTIGYMSPEQVRGAAADHRADVFALGAVLYEMLSGRRAFCGDTAADVMSAILKADPPDLPLAERHIPPALARIVGRCLEKNPPARFQSTRDLGFALEALSTHSGQPEAVVVPRSPARRKQFVALVGAALLLVAATVAGVVYVRPAARAPMQKLSILAPQGTGALGTVALSPDGSRLAFAARSEGTLMLWVRPLDSASATPLSGTEGAGSPFWSPDSHSIGFFAQGKLKRISVSGGPAQTLCDAPSGRGGTWNREGVILFSPDQLESLYQVPGGGGTPQPVTKVDRANGEVAHSYPSFLPDGRHFLYSVTGPDAENSWIRVGELGSAESRPLVKTNSNAVYVGTGSSNYLLFAREGVLLAHAFDAGTLAIVGEPAPVTEERILQSVSVGSVRTAASYAAFSVSETGTLVYREGTGATQTQLAWVDRAGRAIASLGTSGRYDHVELSPDGRRVAVDRYDDQGQTDIWLIDVSSGTPTRFTFSPGRFAFPRWAPDGTRLVFSDDQPPGLSQKPASGAGAEERLYDSSDLAGTLTSPGDWSPDGQSIVFRNLPPGTQGELWLLSLAGQRQTRPVPQTEMRGTNGRFSPDGRWLAYQSSESGRAEVYVQPFPSTGAKWLISRNGGVRPRWRRDGKELFYVTAEGTLSATPIVAGETFQAGEPTTLFDVSFNPTGANAYPYAASPDGQRFLVITPEETASSVAISVVLNWASALRN